MTPTAFQKQCIEIIDELNAAEFGGWFKRSSVMAFIQIESVFRPHAYRLEPSGVASYGLMQVLDITAKALGHKGSPTQMYDPRVSILYGMKCARKTWDIVLRRFGEDVLTVVTREELEQWCDAYNRGPMGANLGDEVDHPYIHMWLTARTIWLPFDKAEST